TLMRNVDRLAAAGAAGVSIEDYDPRTRAVDAVDRAAARVAAAARATRAHGMVLTARAEGLLYRTATLAETIARLRAYRAAGADVVFAPGVMALDDVARLVAEVDAPLNVLALPHCPSVPELAAAGVRRVSTGGALAWAAYGALVGAARELADRGTLSFLEHA